MNKKILPILDIFYVLILMIGLNFNSISLSIVIALIALLLVFNYRLLNKRHAPLEIDLLIKTLPMPVIVINHKSMKIIMSNDHALALNIPEVIKGEIKDEFIMSFQTKRSKTLKIHDKVYRVFSRGNINENKDLIILAFDEITNEIDNCHKIEEKNKVLTDKIRIKNENMKIFNELIIEISKLDSIQKLKERNFIIKVFRILFDALKKADFGSVYLSNEGNVIFVDAIGHDLVALNNEKYKTNDFVFPKSQVGLIKDINVDFIDSIKNENNQLIRLAKETLVISIKDGDDIYGALALDISADSDENFNEDDLVIAETIAKLINSYYKNIKEQLNIKKKMKLEKERLIEQINIDDLTQLFNKKYFFEVYLSIYEKLKFLNFPLGVLLIDIDDYKNYNDTYGHVAGDECLKNVANIFVQHTRKSDVVARYGGEEFIILVENENSNQVYQIGEKLRRAVEALEINNYISEEHSKLTISVGVCTLTPSDNIEPMKVIHQGDHALYQSKRNGKNQTSIIELN